MLTQTRSNAQDRSRYRAPCPLRSARRGPNSRQQSSKSAAIFAGSASSMPFVQHALAVVRVKGLSTPILTCSVTPCLANRSREAGRVLRKIQWLSICRSRMRFFAAHPLDFADGGFVQLGQTKPELDPDLPAGRQQPPVTMEQRLAVEAAGFPARRATHPDGSRRICSASTRSPGRAAARSRAGFLSRITE